MTGKPVLTALGQANRYHRRVFLAPPWPEIYETDRNGVTDWMWPWPNIRACSKLIRRSATKS
jgi:hypothetical protein